MNYQEALKVAAHGMVRVKSPVHLIKMITRFVNREVGVSHASMIIRQYDKDYFAFCDSSGQERVPVSLVRLDMDHPLIKWFTRDVRRNKQLFKKQDYIELNQLNAIIDARTCDEATKKRMIKIKQCLHTFKASLCVPSYYKGELLGILLLGKKQNRRGFSDEEILFFQTLASDASMSLKNADFQRKLLEKISELEASVAEIQGLRERDKDKYLQTLITLAHMVDARDPYTYGHSEEIKKYGTMVAQELAMDLSGERERILTSSLLLHDVGKLGVPDAILHKCGPLTEEEWFKMRDHVKVGARILENHDDFKEVSVIILHHHENFDGSGYPLKLKGDEIPIQSRIISVVDSFHAMVSDRPYRKGLSYDYAIQELRRCSGKQFDAHVVDAFIRVLKNERSV